MTQSNFSKTLATITKKLKWSKKTGVGYSSPLRRDVYLNPLVTPPPRSPKTPEDFMHPERLGHWKSLGYNHTDPVVDRYLAHESFFIFTAATFVTLYMFAYGPDFKGKEWAKREAFLRTHKREALGLPLIEKDCVDPERVVLPTEEEIGNFYVGM